ncbi:putative Uncharacterized oxidoreductase YhdF [Nannochloris sp. 'desiccata']|nr:putative Uncharacterized oxidoreductase YhdF [Chlorella desiccata (nom. nud.)]
MSSYTTVWDPTSSTYFTLISALFNSSAMLRALFTAYTRTPALQTAPIAAARNFIAPLLYTAQPSPRLAFNPQVATMSSKDDQQPTGMATEGLPKGPEIKEHSQINKEHPAIGIQKEMETPPEITRLPTQHGHQDVLSLEEYMGVGKLKGRRVIITGGDSGIGLSAAVMMAREGAHGIAVVYHPSEQDDADTAKKMIEKEGSKCLLIPVNLAEGEPAAKRIVDQVVGAWNKVDILVNNAAVQHVIPSIVDCDPEVLEKTFKVNIFPMFYLAKHAVPHMVRGSTIINTTSVVAYQGSPSLLEYSSTKGAIVAFTRSLAKQLAPKGIRVNAVAPGPIWTPLQVSTWGAEAARKLEPPPLGRYGQIVTPLNPATREQENLDKWMDKDTPLGRIGQPSECGPSYVFLASQESSFMTGQVLHVDGGMFVGS